MDAEADMMEDDFVFYSLLYTSITVLFAMAVLSKFLTHEFRFGFRSFLSLIVLFIGEPLCHLLLKGPTGVTMFGLGCLVIYSILPASHLPVGTKAVLVTGCDSGFGNALVKKLDSIGMRVYAGCLYKNGPGAIDIQTKCSERTKVIELDVTDSKHITEAFCLIKAEVGEEGLWGLVNNAGIWCMAELEMTPENVFHQVLEVNLWSVIRITRTFLPLIRKAQGRIINMSSLTGRVGFEYFGAYCVSKSGIEAYSDVLRLELKKWNVKVCIIEPSGFKTGSTATQLIKERRDWIWGSLDEETKNTYGKDYFNKIYENYEAIIPSLPTDLTPVVRAMRSALLSKRPRCRYEVGLGTWSFLTLFPLMPMWLGDCVVRSLGFMPRNVGPLGLQR